jgi:Vacuolar sorting-associated protein 13, N-terminal
MFRSLGHWHGYLYDGVGDYRWRDMRFSMITLVLVPAEGEHRIKANGWFSKGRCAVTGSWSKDENGVVKINFKMTFDISMFPVFFSGQFDTEREALTGKWACSAEDAETDYPMGVIEFRRIPPCYLSLYPPIQELSRDKPRALWQFVIAAVRHDIRRDHWPWSYFSQRRDDRERVIALLIRSRYFGRTLTGEEYIALTATLQRLTPADAYFYHSKADLMRAKTCIHV